MILQDYEFAFKPSPQVARARRVLIKPCAHYPAPYPVSTSPDILRTIIESIRQVSDADILILEGTPGGGPIYPIYKTLGYDFPRVLMLDVKDCTLVEVENPLPKPLAVPTFWVPNVILSSDYLISVSPMKVYQGQGELSIMNLLSLLPSNKYGNNNKQEGWADLHELGMENVITDLFFTLPFDLGIIEARQKFVSWDEPTQGDVEDFSKVFIGEPYQVDAEASAAAEINMSYLDMIKEARVGFET